MNDWTEHRRRRGLRRLVSATGFSIAGLQAAWQHEESFRLDAVLTVISIPLALWLGRNVTEFCLLVGSFLILLITELLNSGIEALTDRISTENHELSRRAKDLGSAAVFIGILIVILVWGALLVARISS